MAKVLNVADERRSVARRYFLLDVVANYGVDSDGDSKQLAGSLVIPGYGPFFGMKVDDLVTKAMELAPCLREDWKKPQVVLGDIRWLTEQGFAMAS